MLDRLSARGVMGFIGVVAVVLIAIPPGSANQQPDSSQVRELADLAADLLNCSVHPCLGETEQVVRELLKGQIVSDGIFYYSDLVVAYPSVRDSLRGLIEWDFGSALDMVSFKVTDFYINPAALVAELEIALPGCEMEQDEEAGENGESEAWSCEASNLESSGTLVEVYFGHGLVLLEIGS